MKTLGISEFKTHCIRLLKEAHQSREPLLVTHRGKPLVRIEAAPGTLRQRKLGGLENQIEIREELVGLDFDEDWEL